MSLENPKVFISYRRKDSAYAALQIYTRLIEEFGKGSVEFDVDTIPLGDDFREYLGKQISECDVLLAVIGDNWLEVGVNNESRIHNDNDFVRYELETALHGGVIVMPVLVGQASIPAKTDLPDSLHNLPGKNAAEFRPGRDGPAQLERLVTGIKKQIETASRGKSVRWHSKTSRLAMVVGLDDYNQTSFESLTGCAADASRIAGLLSKHSSGKRNFEVRTVLKDCTQETLKAGIAELFESEVDVALFYFAGQAINEEVGYLVAQDATRNQQGVAFSELIDQVNNSNALERIVILDCCTANQTGELFVRKKPLSLAEGVTILAVRRDEPDFRKWDSISATSLICDTLEGGGVDLTGSVTIADLYNHLNASGGFSQKLYLRANLSSLGSIRQAEPSIAESILANIKMFFPDSPNQPHELSPAYEPEAEPKDEVREAIFAELQALTRANLVEPAPPHKHMYFAAMENGVCRLTNLGRFYWVLSNQGRFGAPSKELP